MKCVQSRIRESIKRLSLVVQAMALLSLTTSAYADDSDYVFVTNDYGAITITGYNGLGGDIIIPSSLSGRIVTEIGSSAFEWRALTGAIIPDTVDIIWNGAFSSCLLMTNLVIGPSVGHVGRAAFSNCRRLSTISIPNSVGVIDEYAFAGCTNLAHIAIGSGVVYFGTTAFENCPSIASIIYDCNASWPFGQPPNLTNLVIGNNATAIPAVTYSALPKLQRVVVGNNVGEIGYGTFANCSNLTSITIGNNVSQINGMAFYGCIGLRTIAIPASVTSLGDEAFRSCAGITNILIGNGVSTIGRSAFQNCSGLLRITIPENITTIEESVFSGCSNLTSITLPNNVTRIGDRAFYGCVNITNVIIGNSVAQIGGGSFAGCIGLTSLTIPNSVTDLGDQCFGNCYNIASVYFSGVPPRSGNLVFWLYYSDNNITYYTPNPALTIYRLPSANGWPQVPNPWDGHPTAFWLPQVAEDGSMGVNDGMFGFNVNWVPGEQWVIDACTDLNNPGWEEIYWSAFSGNSTNFSDPEWSNFPSRYYRIRPWP